MLGIIFTGGLGPPAQEIKRILDTEVNNAKNEGVLIIAADSGLTAAVNAGVKPHWIIGDMDSLTNPAQLAEYPADRVIRHPCDKDFTDTELAFNLAVDKGCNVMWLAGGGGGRIDHLFGIHSMLEREIFPLRWITEKEDIHCIDGSGIKDRGVKNIISCTLQKGACVSVFPLGGGPWEARSEGLKWPLDNVKWNRGFFGSSNVAETGSFSISARSGRFMVILPLL